MPFLSIVGPLRHLRHRRASLSPLFSSVQCGSEISKKDHASLAQSVYLRCQFHEIQLHVHRPFVFRDPPDPELSESSVIVCKNAAKQCIALVNSTKDLLLTSLYFFGLVVSADPYPLSWWFNLDS